jgi:hypothetical protein
MLEEEQDNSTFEGGNFSASVSIVDTPEEIDDEHVLIALCWLCFWQTIVC